MIHPTVQSVCYLIIILLGVLLRNKGVLTKEDGKKLAIISVTITLPASLLSSFKGMKLQNSLIFVAIFGFAINIVMLGVAFIVYSKDTKQNRALGMLNNASYNVGSFSLPYIVNMFDPTYIIYASMFDIGNSIYAMGTNLAIIDTYLHSDSKFDIKSFAKNFLSSIPFLTYMLLILMLTLRIELPNFVYQVATTIGSANIFIVMLMFGIMFDPDLDIKDIKLSIRVLLTRYTTQGIALLLIWNFAPLDIKVLQVITLCLMSPMTSVVPNFTSRLGLNERSSGVISSISVFISILINSILTNIWL